MSSRPITNSDYKLELQLVRNEGYFGTLDQDRNKKLDKKEIEDFAKKFGLEFEALFQELDENKDGEIIAEELQSGFHILKDLLFSKIAPSGQEYFTASDLKEFSKTYNLDNDKVFEHLDQNKDGRVDKAEFKQKIGGILHHLSRYTKQAGDRKYESGADYIVKLSRQYEQSVAKYTKGNFEGYTHKGSANRSIDDQKLDVNDFNKTYDLFANALWDQMDPLETGEVDGEKLNTIAGVFDMNPGDLKKLFDLNRDGKISKEEFKKQLASVFKKFQETHPSENEDDSGWALEFNVEEKVDSVTSTEKSIESKITLQSATARIDIYG